tara:strand:+ start:128 stop:325 length:198 start_codon:yes stop_codon:yes gene_type:complete
MADSKEKEGLLKKATTSKKKAADPKPKKVVVDLAALQNGWLKERRTRLRREKRRTYLDALAKSKK